MTLDQKLSPQSREHSIYLINYLRNLFAKHLNEQNRNFEENKFGDSDNYTVGKNDKYLITKLKSYNITLDKIDNYLLKL